MKLQIIQISSKMAAFKTTDHFKYSTASCIYFVFLFRLFSKMDGFVCLRDW